MINKHDYKKAISWAKWRLETPGGGGPSFPPQTTLVAEALIKAHEQNMRLRGCLRASTDVLSMWACECEDKATDATINQANRLLREIDND